MTAQAFVPGDHTVNVSPWGKAIDVSSDVDLTNLFPDQAYVRRLRNGDSVARNVVVRYVKAPTTDVTLSNVPSGGYVDGIFVQVTSSGTTGSNWTADM